MNAAKREVEIHYYSQKKREIEDKESLTLTLAFDGAFRCELYFRNQAFFTFSSEKVLDCNIEIVIIAMQVSSAMR